MPPTGGRDSAGAEAKSEAKGGDGGRKASVDGAESRDAGRRGSGESLGRRESRGGGGSSGSDEKVLQGGGGGGSEGKWWWTILKPLPEL